jgi:hypothetical protein
MSPNGQRMLCRETLQDGLEFPSHETKLATFLKGLPKQTKRKTLRVASVSKLK